MCTKLYTATDYRAFQVAHGRSFLCNYTSVTPLASVVPGGVCAPNHRRLELSQVAFEAQICYSGGVTT